MTGDRRLGGAIRARRKERGLSLDALVERVNERIGKEAKQLTKATLHRAERGEATLIELHLEAIAEELGMAVDALPREPRGGLFEAQLSAPQLRVTLDQLDAAQEVLRSVTQDLEEARSTILRGLGQRSGDPLDTLQIVPVGTQENPLILAHEALDARFSKRTARAIAEDDVVRDPIVIVRNASTPAGKHVALDGQSRLQSAVDHADVFAGGPLKFLPAQVFDLSEGDAGGVVLMTWHHGCSLSQEGSEGREGRGGREVLLEAARSWEGCQAIEGEFEHRIEAMIEDGSAVATVFFETGAIIPLVLTGPTGRVVPRREQTIEGRSRLLQNLVSLYAQQEGEEPSRHRLALPGSNLMVSAREILKRHEACVVFARWSIEDVIELAVRAEKEPGLRLPHGITRTVVVEGRLANIRVKLDVLREAGGAAGLRTDQVRSDLAKSRFRLFVESTQVYL